MSGRLIDKLSSLFVGEDVRAAQDRGMRQRLRRHQDEWRRTARPKSPLFLLFVHP
jgi:hypothetical protein